jgi:guanine deaminase
MTNVAYRGMLLDYVGDPAVDTDAVRVVNDGLLVVQDGYIRMRGAFDDLRASVGEIPIVDYRSCILTSGFIDAHVHYPQSGMIASCGSQLLEWLDSYTFPAERAFADVSKAKITAEFFVQELLRNGTTTAVVLCTVHPGSVEVLAEVALQRNMRMLLGKILMDRNAPEDLRDSAQLGYDDSKRLIDAYHDKGRLSYAITPRFAATSTPLQLELAGVLHQEYPSTYVHTHLSESLNEVRWVESLFPERRSYTDVYAHYGLVGPRSIFAHGIHLSPEELEVLAVSGSTIAFCPTSNLFLGSGLFSMDRARRAGVNIALATDVGAGTSFSMLQTLNEAYKVQQLQGLSLAVHQGFYAVTLGAARALRLDQHIGNLEVGKEADFLVLDPKATPLLRFRCEAALNQDDLLFALMMLGDDRAVRAVYVAGKRVHTRD